MKIRILSFGHLPKDIGGKQKSGQATAIWNIAKFINASNSKYEIIIAATDFKHNSSYIDNTKIIGWQLFGLIRYILQEPLKTLKYFINAILLKIQYNLPIINSLGKILFYDISIGKTLPHIVHIHAPDRYLIIKQIKHYDSIKRIITLHGISGQDPHIPFYKRCRKMEISINGCCSYLTFVSALVEKQWIEYYGQPASPTKVVLNGYDPSIFHLCDLQEPKDDNKLVILTLGSVSERKGQFRVIKAMSKLQNKHDFKYICVGSVSKSDLLKLRNEADKDSIDLEITGYIAQREMVKYLYAADYMILPSSSEGFGQVYIESIACGTPVILPKNLPLAREEGILNEKNSIFINNSDEDSILDCLIKLQSFSYARKDVADTVLHLTWGNIARKYIDVFDNTLCL